MNLTDAQASIDAAITALAQAKQALQDSTFNVEVKPLRSGLFGYYVNGQLVASGERTGPYRKLSREEANKVYAEEMYW